MNYIRFISYLYSVVTSVLVVAVCLFGSCSSRNVSEQGTYVNPIVTKHENTSVYFHEGTYYYITETGGALILYSSDDPTKLEQMEATLVSSVWDEYGLIHAWHPQITNIDGKWYIYFSADEGNTDDRRIYVLENSAADPREGKFDLRTKIVTDPGDNLAIHAHVFKYDGQLYMLWSGWESKRVYAETQCIYIARMDSPCTLSSERIKISEPEYEWERQWVNPEGYKTAYPIYVNEAPFFFGNERTDKLYIYYSASAMWTPYYAIGELSAAKGSDLLDSGSWKKKSRPAFSMSDPKWERGEQAEDDVSKQGVYAPGFPYIIPSPDGTEYYLLYMARDELAIPFTIRMQKIEFSSGGVPDLGVPVPLGVPLSKPSGL